MKRFFVFLVILASMSFASNAYVHETEYFTFHYKTSRMQKLHRVDGPAVYGCRSCVVLSNIDWVEEWYLEGKKHREDGPAVVEYIWDGAKYVVAMEEYWLSNKWYTKEEYNSIVGGFGGKGGGKGKNK